MSLDARFEGHSGSSAMTLRLEGSHDIFRFAVNMLHQQVEFCAAGRAMLVELREHLTPPRFDPMALSLLGEERYETLRSYFERDRFCASCHAGIVAGERYEPLANAQALCEECSRDNQPPLEVAK